jgi:hypothetical protein
LSSNPSFNRSPVSPQDHAGIPLKQVVRRVTMKTSQILNHQFYPLSSPAFADKIRLMIDASSRSWATKQYDRYQEIVNGIAP